MTALTITCPLDCVVDHDRNDPGIHAEANQYVRDVYGHQTPVALTHDERTGTAVAVDGREYSIAVALRLANLIRQAVDRAADLPGVLR